jgi:hypothetical protein
LYPYASADPVGFVDPSGLWGFGALGSASAEAGNAALGVGATGALGGGVFVGPDGVTVGGFASAGGFVGGLAVPTVSFPSTTQPSFAIGGFGGGGGGAFLTNASCAENLQGPFTTYSLNLGLGFGEVSIQFGLSENGTFIASLTGGPVGLGLSLSGFPTTAAGKTAF